jgi:hypothetical protein
VVPKSNLLAPEPAKSSDIHVKAYVYHPKPDSVPKPPVNSKYYPQSNLDSRQVEALNTDYYPRYRGLQFLPQTKTMPIRPARERSVTSLIPRADLVASAPQNVTDSLEGSHRSLPRINMANDENSFCREVIVICFALDSNLTLPSSQMQQFTFQAVPI